MMHNPERLTYYIERDRMKKREQERKKGFWNGGLITKKEVWYTVNKKNDSLPLKPTKETEIQIQEVQKQPKEVHTNTHSN